MKTTDLLYSENFILTRTELSLVCTCKK